MKHSFEEKLNVVSEITSGKAMEIICRERHLDKHQVRGWLVRYSIYGEEGLLKSTKGYHCNKQILNRHFSVNSNRHILIETIGL